MATAADATDVQQTHQYPLHEAKATGGGASYFVRSRHALSMGHGRVTYAQFPPEGTVDNLFSRNGQETNFYISANQTQLVSQMGVHGKLMIAPPTVNLSAVPPDKPTMHTYFPIPTPLWMDIVEVYFGAALLSTYTKGYNYTSFMKMLTAADYRTLAGVCFLEGGIFHDENLNCTIPDNLAKQYNPFPLRAGLAVTPLIAGAAPPVTSIAVGANYGVVGQTARLEGQEGVSGCSFRMPSEYGGGIPLSNMMPLIAGRGVLSIADTGIPDSTDASHTILPLRALDYAIKTWSDGTYNSGIVEREFYIPLHNWLTCQALWMPHLNQRVRIYIRWTQQVNALPIASGGGRVYVSDSYRGIPYETLENRINYNAGAFNTFTPWTAAADALPANPTPMEVYAQRLDGNPNVTIGNLNLVLRGYQFNADLASNITALHKKNNVVSRVTVPRVGEIRAVAWQKNSPIVSQKQGFTGVFAQLDHLITYRSTRDTSYNAIGRLFQTSTPISKVATCQLEDPSGLAYGFSNMAGVTIQDAFKAYTYAGSMYPYLFRSITFPFSPDPVGALVNGERKGSQYLNGQWRINLSPACDAPLLTGKEAIPGETTGTQYPLQCIILEYGDQFATITEHPSGSISMRYL